MHSPLSSPSLPQWSELQTMTTGYSQLQVLNREGVSISMHDYVVHTLSRPQ